MSETYQSVNIITQRDFIQLLNQLGIDSEIKVRILTQFNKNNIVNFNGLRYLLGNKNELVYVPSKNITINDLKN